MMIDEEVQADEEYPEEEPVADAAQDGAHHVEVLPARQRLVLVDAHDVEGLEGAVGGDDDADNDDEDGALEVGEGQRVHGVLGGKSGGKVGELGVVGGVGDEEEGGVDGDGAGRSSRYA